jgi:hypothetical protein
MIEGYGGDRGLPAYRERSENVDGQHLSLRKNQYIRRTGIMQAAGAPSG